MSRSAAPDPPKSACPREAWSTVSSVSRNDGRRSYVSWTKQPVETSSWNNTFSTDGILLPLSQIAPSSITIPRRHARDSSKAPISCGQSASRPRRLESSSDVFPRAPARSANKATAMLSGEKNELPDPASSGARLHPSRLIPSTMPDVPAFTTSPLAFQRVRPLGHRSRQLLQHIARRAARALQHVEPVVGSLDHVQRGA